MPGRDQALISKHLGEALTACSSVLMRLQNCLLFPMLEVGFPCSGGNSPKQGMLALLRREGRGGVAVELNSKAFFFFFF